jgi:tRNA U34 2-thiouridine synthase MnmA/TrmU
MFKEAYQKKEAKGFDILATGEVLGQRPFSQNTGAFKKIENYLDMEGNILRPLSGKILSETVYEKKNLVNREQLEDVQGRSRKKQLQLAKDFGVEYFPTPAGGCCLTEKDFSVKLEKLMNFCEEPVKSDFELLRLGRHSWEDVESRMVHFVAGRNKEENEKITALKEKSDLLMVSSAE